MKKSGFNTASGKYCCNYKQRSNFIGTRNEVSIPQAVSTVATVAGRDGIVKRIYGFNTASGKYCCNYDTSM